MKILRLQAYSDPERVSSTHLTNDLYEALENAGIQSEIYVPTPSRGIDKETRKKYKKIKHETRYAGTQELYRFSMLAEGKNPIMRALRYLFCSIAHYRKGVHAKNIDVVYASSTPPTQGMISAMVAKRLSKKAKRKIPFVYNLQDVFPDSLVTTGMAKKNSLLFKLGRKIENYTYKHADTIIVISESIKQNLLAKGVPEEKIAVVPNWIDTEAVRPVARENNRLYEELGIPKDKFTVLYAGNMGAAQGAGVILDAAERLCDNADIQFVIFGGGAEFEAAKARAEALPNVFIHPLLPQDRVPEVYSLGDLALITCKRGTGSAGMPSKTWTIMACGTPILAAFDTDSELADILAQANAGRCVAPEDAEALAAAILAFRALPEEARPHGGRAYVEKYASRALCVGKYVEILKNAAEAAEKETV